MMEGLEIASRERPLVQEVGLTLRPGALTALVGSSGSGKTLTTRSLLGMVDFTPGVVKARLTVRVDGAEHRPYEAGGRRAVERAFRPLRGGVLGYLPQDARGSLDPLRTVGGQLTACLKLAGAAPDPRDSLSRAGFPDPARVARLYPHELSGGMAQRASIAMALARGSRFLLADEPTTGLDPTVQEAILQELLRLKAAGVGILLITHDLRLVPRVADRVLVMSGGRLVEDLPAERMGQMVSEQGRALLAATARVSGGALEAR
jgi:peptide/nickel transport system ATP-binding protein